MKKIFFIMLILALLAALKMDATQSFSQFAAPDADAMRRIQGKWVIEGRSYIYSFTSEPVRRIDGFMYYRYSVSQYPGVESLYAIFKSKKSGKMYFCRGYWDKKYGFQQSASLISFDHDDSFVVFSKDNPGQVFFQAVRLNDKPEIRSPVQNGRHSGKIAYKNVRHLR